MRGNLEIVRGLFPNISKESIVPGFLRSDVATANGANNTIFPILKGEKTAFTQESLLDYKDAFVITKFGLFLLFETVGAEGKGKLLTYPSGAVLTGTGITLADLEKVYNGKLSVKNGQRVLFDAYPTKNFRVARTSQQVTAGTNQNGIATDESLPGDGFAPAEAMPILKGNEKIEISLNRPAVSSEGVQLTTTTSNIVKVVFFAQGYFVYGGGGQ